MIIVFFGSGLCALSVVSTKNKGSGKNYHGYLEFGRSQIV